MKKEASLILTVLIISLFLLTFVKANDVESIIKIDNVQHRIQFVSVGSNEATLRIYNNDTTFSPVQSLQEFYPTQKGDLYFVLTNARVNNSNINATFLIGIKKEFWINNSDSDKIINLTFDGNKHIIELLSAGSDDATFNMDGNTYHSNMLQPPYDIVDYPELKKGGLYFILTEAAASNSELNATFLIFYEKKFGTYILGPLCDNECNTANEAVCSGSDSYKTCGNYDEDSCLEWSSLVKCNSNELCESGICKTKIVPTPTPPNPNPAPNPPNYCEPVGIRDNTRYCSIEKEWLNQKNENSICNNNFECQNNICSNGYCQSKSSSGKTTLYLIIGLIAIILIIGIIYIIRASKNR